MLTSQINPHFLYNTLETIRMKARINKQYEIEELVKMLGKILRSSIQAGSKDMTIREEVELAEYYLKIQQYRFGERIQYQIYVEEGIERQKILPLLIQPLVENCIIHGLEGRERTSVTSISVSNAADRMWSSRLPMTAPASAWKRLRRSAENLQATAQRENISASAMSIRECGCATGRSTA